MNEPFWSQLTRSQLTAIIRYELVNSWRRGSLVALILMMALLPFVFNGLSSISDRVAQANLSLWPEQALIIHTGAAIGMNIFVVVLEIFILPLLVAEVIPLDRQYRVREILDGLPMRTTTYLAGKICSIWLVFAVCSLVQALVNGVLAWRTIGPYRVDILVSFWVFGLLMLGLFSSGMAILLSVKAENHSQAILVGILAALLSLGVFFLLPSWDYLWSGLKLSVLVQMATPEQTAQAAPFPAVMAPGYLLRIGLVLGILAVLWGITVRRVRRMRAED
jgi:hypothetical protein